MGFTVYEKKTIVNQLLTNDEVKEIRDDELDDELHEFLQSQNHLRNIRDYAIIPRNISRKNKFENLTLVKYFSTEFDFATYIETIGSCLTPPYEMKIDFNFVVSKPHEQHNIVDKYRFVWAQRSLAFKIKQNIADITDFEALLTKIKTYSYTDLLNTTFANHMRQSCFDRSGYNPNRLLCSVLFLSKLGPSTVNSDYLMN